MSVTINLFEFQKLFEFEKELPSPNNFDAKGFFEFLDKVWQEREKTPFFREFYKSYENDAAADYDSEKKEKQQFLSEYRDNKIKARNYIGIIHYDGYTFNLLPKIFYKNGKDPDATQIEQIQKNILWWLSYSKRLKLPKLESDFNKIKTNSFFEILIYLFATYTSELFTRQIYQNYTDVERELPFVKGRIDMNAYIKNNLSTGNWAKIACVYDSFEMDNILNRIIKYVCKLLLPQTRVPETKRKLYDILFTLDEVTDTVCLAQDCEKVKINPLFSEMQTVLDYCKLFLANSMVFTWKKELKVFAFLLPMEKLFEEFVSGFMETHKNEIFGNNYNLSPQSNKYFLAENLENNTKEYYLRPDISILKGKDIKYLIDCKYKLIYQANNDTPAQSDMYQMLAYAVRHKCRKIKLFYPQCAEENVSKNPTHCYLVDDKFSDTKISIVVHKIPVILTQDAYDKTDETILIESLKSVFSSNENSIKNQV